MREKGEPAQNLLHLGAENQHLTTQEGVKKKAQLVFSFLGRGGTYWNTTAPIKCEWLRLQKKVIYANVCDALWPTQKRIFARQQRRNPNGKPLIGTRRRLPDTVTW